MESSSAFIQVLLLVVCIAADNSEDTWKKKLTRKDRQAPRDDNHAQNTNLFGVGQSAEIGNHGKYFQYQHQPAKDHYEFGYRRGNEHHFQERHEKAAPHHGHFQTKVRWGDKHGGYGEHYWDYNHGDHHDEGDASSPVSEYASAEDSKSDFSQLQGHARTPNRRLKTLDRGNTRLRLPYPDEATLWRDQVSVDQTGLSDQRN